MKAQYSDGQIKIGERLYQVANPRVIMTAAQCPYCGCEHDDIDQEVTYTCNDCKKEFAIGSLVY